MKRSIFAVFVCFFLSSCEYNYYYLGDDDEGGNKDADDVSVTDSDEVTDDDISDAGEDEEEGDLLKDDDLTEILDGEEYDHLVGYEINDKTTGKIGIIEEIVEMPFQFLAKVMKDKKEILIPLNNNFILNIDEKKKLVEVQLPDGFLEIF